MSEVQSNTKTVIKQKFWSYIQKTGEVIDPNGTLFDSDSYSGHGEGLNNPDMENVPNIGPIPAGVYEIGRAHYPEDHLGPIALRLYAFQTNNMYGRFGFFWHGDNAFMNHTASNGCIISSRNTRQRVQLNQDISDILKVYHTLEEWKAENVNNS